MVTGDAARPLLPALAVPLARMAAGSGGRCSPGDLIEMVLSGRVTLWLAIDGAEIRCVVATETHDYPRSRALRFIGIVGEKPRTWVHLRHDLRRIARDELGCDRMEAVGPRRFASLLGAGWREWHTIWESHL